MKKIVKASFIPDIFHWPNILGIFDVISDKFIGAVYFKEQ